MTRQEKIKEGIVNLFAEFNLHIGDGVDDCAGYDYETENKALDSLLHYLHSQGCVLKAELSKLDADLPLYQCKGCGAKYMSRYGERTSKENLAAIEQLI